MTPTPDEQIKDLQEQLATCQMFLEATAQARNEATAERDALRAQVLKNEVDMRTYHIALNDAAWTLVTVKNILPASSLILPMVEASINLTPEKAIALGKEFDAFKAKVQRYEEAAAHLAGYLTIHGDKETGSLVAFVFKDAAREQSR